MKKADFQGSLQGRSVNLYTLKNSHGISASVTNFGARLVAFEVPDRQGNTDNIIVGYSSMDEFVNNEESYFGAVIGRYANRIASGNFAIGDQVYQLPRNEGQNHLHGGPRGFHGVVWGADQIDPQTLNLSYRSTDGEGGYPGNMGAQVTYKLTDNNKLTIEFRAESDEATILNMTHHAYYNLHGAERSRSVDSHQLLINADRFTPVDSDLIPTGQIQPVSGTPLDFRQFKQIGKERQADHPLLQHTGGYDHNFVLNRNSEDENLTLAAQVKEEQTGRALDLFTSEPGMQFYVSQNPVPGADSAFCLEPQHFPDSPNQPHFPSTRIDGYEPYKWNMVLAFKNF